MLAPLRRRLDALGPSALARRFLVGASWSLAASATSQGLSLVTLVLVARFLGQEAFGQLVAVQSTIAVGAMLAGLGLATAVTHSVASLRAQDPARLGRVLGLGEAVTIALALLAALLMWGLAPRLASDVFHAPGLAGALSVAGLAVLLTTVDGYYKGVLLGLEAVRPFALTTMAGALLALPLMLWGADRYGVQGAAWALVLAALVQAPVSRLLAGRLLRLHGLRPHLAGCLAEWPVVRDYALPYMLAAALANGAHWLCQAALARSPQGFAELAILGVAMQWHSAVTFVPMVASRVVFPMLTEQVATHQAEGSRRLLGLALLTNAAVALPTALAIGLASPWLLSLYGVGAGHGAAVLGMAMAAACLAGMAAPASNLMMAKGGIWHIVGLNLAWTTTYVMLGVPGATLGAVGVVGALTVSQALNATWLVVWTRRELRRGVT